MRTFATAILSVLLLSTVVGAAEPSAADLDKRRKALDDLITEQWEYQLRTAPGFASILGDKRYNDRSSDFPRPRTTRPRETRRFCAIRGDGHHRLSRTGELNTS